MYVRVCVYRMVVWACVVLGAGSLWWPCWSLSAISSTMWPYVNIWPFDTPLTAVWPLADAPIQCQSPLPVMRVNPRLQHHQHNQNFFTGEIWRSFTEASSRVWYHHANISWADTCLWGLCLYLLFMWRQNDTSKCRHTWLTCLLILAGILSWQLKPI